MIWKSIKMMLPLSCAGPVGSEIVTKIVPVESFTLAMIEALAGSTDPA